MVDPAKEVINDYESLLVVETAVINALKPGAKLCDAYKAGVDALRESNPDMIDKLTKNNFG
jgi:nucleosome binding factor SPN SPT16 subunit